jgi:hypothetical protein
MPGIMLTITPVDDMSFRIGVYFNGEEGSSKPPMTPECENTKKMSGK